MAYQTPPTIYKNHIRENRRPVGITQEQFAKSLSIHEKTVQEWERGAAVTQLVSRKRLSELLGDDAKESAKLVLREGA